MDFKNRISDVLITTDITGRGIDIEGVTAVINYNAPKTIKEYTHRIGRTGRAGRSGLAFTFISEEDAELIPKLIATLKELNQEVSQSLKDLENTLTRQGVILSRNAKITD